ncbi:MAG: sporulation protein YtxC, partial [Halanaerobiales bacterium]
ELMEDDVEYEDLLISALINISPAQIILHFEQQKVINTLKRIFDERIIICKGCQLCRKDNIDEE